MRSVFEATDPSRLRSILFAVLLFPKLFGQREAGEIFSGKPRIRLDAEALNYGDQLACVLRGVPSGTLE